MFGIKTSLISLFIFIALIFSLIQTPFPDSIAQQMSHSIQESDRLVENFRPAKELLLRKGVPFEPELLLRKNWAKELSTKLSEMPEMQVPKQLGNKIEGVQLGDILYLPEKTQLTGDTVILANKIVFEGRDAVIKGNYNVYFFPVDIEGVLGESLETAMNEQMTFQKAGFNNSSRLKRFSPKLLQSNWSLTIDTSGFGRKEWLENQNKKTSNTFQKISFLQDQNTSGTLGTTGTQGPDGLMGSNGEPNPAASGFPSFCGVNNNSGGPGENAEPGGTGISPEQTGGIGGPGGHAGIIDATITNSTGTHTFLANGGNGGQGGKGGPGGTGGSGAQGGPGRDGKDCTCAQGGAGNGSDGGRGGKGGQGGNGGNGGPGGPPGDGNDITVTKPANFTGTILAYANGGNGGPGGEGGGNGLPGLPGAGGNFGRAASRSNCSTSDPQDGSLGLTTGTFGYGNTGMLGEDRQSTRGTSGRFFLITSGGTVGVCNGLPFPNGSCSTGFVNVGGACSRSYAFQSRCAGSGYDPDSCSCPDGTSNSPILIDVDNSGFTLTDAIGGVDFDILALGFSQHISWTANGSTNAFLTLDRNGNGTIDSGEELFGNITPQPLSLHPNGFTALAEYDKPEQGGNSDRVIDGRDAIFSQLRLWQDTNHNGVSESNELHTLSAFGLATLDLDYKESKRTDQYGNQFRYRAKVKDIHGSQLGGWAWDVFLIVQQP